MDFNGIFSVWKECWGWLSMDDVKKMMLISINNFIQSIRDLLSTFYFLLVVAVFLWVSFFVYGLQLIAGASIFPSSILANIFLLVSGVCSAVSTILFGLWYLVSVRPSRERKDRTHFEKMLYRRQFKLLLAVMAFLAFQGFLSCFVPRILKLLIIDSLPLFTFAALFYLDQDSSFSSLGLAAKNSIVMCLYFFPYLAVLGLVAGCCVACGLLFFALATYGFLAIYGLFYQLGFNPVVIVSGMGIIGKYLLAVCVVGFVGASLCFFTSFAATLYTRLKYSHFSLFTNEQS